MMLKRQIVYLLCLLLLIVSICQCEVNQSSYTNGQTEQQHVQQQQQQNKQQQIDPQRLQQVNIVINNYFHNCSLDTQSSVLYDCSISKQKYGLFLYQLFHKQMIMNFLRMYQLQGKLSTENQIQSMYKIGQKVQSLVVNAYNYWIQVYKPNPFITVEEMYGDIPQLDRDVLDVIQHYPQQHHDFIHVLKNIYKISPNQARRYIVMGNKTQQEIAEDYSGILQIYFGQCRPVTQCKMSTNAFVYFVKQLSFYITPLVDQQQGKESILVSQSMDYEATQFLIKQVQRLKGMMGQEVDYDELQKYSQDLAMSLFEHLKNNYDQKQDEDNRTEYNQRQNDL